MNQLSSQLQGILDPVMVLSYFLSLTYPSEYKAPLSYGNYQNFTLKYSKNHCSNIENEKKRGKTCGKGGEKG